MDLDTYDDWAAQESAWLDNRLRREGLEALRATFQQVGEARLHELVAAREAEIRDFLCTPQNRRESMLRKAADETERHCFLIAAAYAARCGAALLNLSTQYGYSAGSGASRSFLLCQASAVAQDLQAHFPTMWPYDDDLAEPIANS